MTTLTDRQMDTLFMIANKYCESFIATLPSITRRIEIINTGVEQDIIDECTTDLFQDINNLSLVAKNILPIKYCYSGLRFDYLWHRENKYYIGSHPMTTTHLLQAIKYQLVANFSEDLPSLLQDERSLMTVVCGYYLAFLTSINNNMTFNTKDLQGNVTRTYTPLSHVNCKRICENIKKQLEEQNYSVTDIRGDVHQLISTDMQKTRRLSKEELQEMISEYT